MRKLMQCAIPALVAVVLGCGGPPAPDTTGVPPPKPPEETQKEIEAAMKAKGMNAQTYGQQGTPKDVPPP